MTTLPTTCRTTPPTGRIRAPSPRAARGGAVVGGLMATLVGLLASGGRAAPPPGAVRLCVDGSASGTGTGANWTDAFTDLQAALAAAGALQAGGADVQLWVAAGTYRPGGPAAPRSSTFSLADGIALYGGFAGGEASITQRDVAAHPTILDGDLPGDDQPAFVNHFNNCYHVVTAAGVGPTAVLDGFTVRGGYASDSAGGNSFGGGLDVTGAAPTVARTTFLDNYAQLSGAVIVLGSTGASFTDCSFQANLSQPNRGGAVYVTNGSVARFTGCRFLSNQAKGFSAPCDGGAMFLEGGAGVTVEDCAFVGNSTSVQAVGHGYSVGGAIANLSDALVLRRCTFAGNSSTDSGGGVWNGGDITIADCSFSGNHSLSGGGLVNFFSGATVEGCSFFGNSAGDGGGMTNSYTQPQVLVRNCVLWGNTSPGQPTYQAQIHNFSGSAQVRHSCVEAIFDTIPGEDPPDPANFPGCTGANPLFTDANGADDVTGTLDDDLSLAPGSPARDAGNNAYVPAGTLSDLVRHPRFRDDPAAPNVGSGTSPLVDMGAFEASSPSPWSVPAGAVGAEGGAAPGARGLPLLRGEGALASGSAGALTVRGARPSAPALLFVSLGTAAVPFQAGVLAAFPPVLTLVLVTGADGTLALSWSAWPAGTSGVGFGFQLAVQDPAGLAGAALSNAAVGAAP